jgi:hypothetical protein
MSIVSYFENQEKLIAFAFVFELVKYKFKKSMHTKYQKH